MILIIIGVIALLTGIFVRALFRYRQLLTGGGIVLIVCGILVASYVQVPAGYRGVLLQFGAVRGVLPEGANFIIPFMQDSEIMEVRTQKDVAQSLPASSQDMQEVKTDVAINYHIDPKDVGLLYKSVGIDYTERIIEPKVQETLKAIVAHYTAEQLIRMRDQVMIEVSDMLTDRLSPYHIVVETHGVSLTNFEFSPEFNQAIEAKQVAQQSAEKQKYILAQAQLEAQTAITAAKGEAEANRIKAQALNTQGGQKVLMRAWIDKWDGKLPTVSSSGGTIIDLKSLMNDKTEQ
jgi:regulator of protease activity HflC (stomatin/prohibitin superfamily)